MARDVASFSVRILGPSTQDKADLDAALAIFRDSTSPLLRTQVNQIRQKIRKPNNPYGDFYFLAFYRGDALIGFAMFGYYRRTRLMVIDHMAISQGQRGSSAFHVFAHLIRDLTENIGLDVDFAIVEVETRGQFGTEQTGGQDLVRLLGQVGFGEVHMDYTIPNMEFCRDFPGYQGTLMIRGPQKLHNIPRDNLVNIYKTMLYEHYLPWFSDFLAADTPHYKTYLDGLFRDFQIKLKDTPIVRINGKVVDQLVPQTRRQAQRTPELRAILFCCAFALCCAVLVAVALVLRIQINVLPLVAIVMLAIFAGVVAVSSGRAYDVFEVALSSFPGGRHRSRYPRSGRSQGPIEQKRRRRLPEHPNSDAR